MTQKQKQTIRGWAGLMTGLAVICTLMFVVGPYFERYESVRTFTTYVKDNDINAGGIWWTDTELTSEAEMGARATMRYLPTGPEKRSVRNEIGTLEFMQ
ncbi:hypothetical protein DPQ33_01225 [Oceanidesulfovibrio indonesiensis]|uniref:Uncharacterized protein n=1 Tax=Oceanidesulfovibrio indonesiensis TaxID=54767 RepID=A0A7M3MJM2_9BACT|nr:hypothetical protein [Oceanidesulfovibrio indonesiensis]TVM19880.1 hypothetical protein DPQ33_01225 [Oceanidesulfovibrio indonesiensis]